MKRTLLGPLVVERAPTARNRVALTFDDGPDPEHTAGLLEDMSRRGLKAVTVSELLGRGPASASGESVATT